jgi:hypothetical protein
LQAECSEQIILQLRANETERDVVAASSVLAGGGGTGGGARAELPDDVTHHGGSIGGISNPTTPRGVRHDNVHVRGQGQREGRGGVVFEESGGSAVQACVSW